MVNGELICELCGKEFDTEEEMVRHFKDNHMTKKNYDAKAKSLFKLLQDNYKGYSVEVSNDKRINETYHITLRSNKPDSTIIKQRYGDFKDDSRMFQNPSTNESLLNAINEKLKTIENIKNIIKPNKQLEFIECIGFYYGDDENEDAYHFIMKLKGDNKVIEENYYHNVDEQEIFIKKLNSYFTQKLEGGVLIEQIWGKEYYIDGVDIDSLMETAKRLNKKVRLEILN